jgi:hypothetical protein
MGLKSNTMVTKLLLMLLSILLIFIGIMIIKFDIAHAKKCNYTIQATVIDVDIRWNDDTKEYKPTFSYTYKDKEYTNSYSYSSKKYRVGDVIDVKINADDPSDTYESIIIFGFFILGIGIYLGYKNGKTIFLKIRKEDRYDRIKWKI